MKNWLLGNGSVIYFQDSSGKWWFLKGGEKKKNPPQSICITPSKIGAISYSIFFLKRKKYVKVIEMLIRRGMVIYLSYVKASK